MMKDKKNAALNPDEMDQVAGGLSAVEEAMKPVLELDADPICRYHDSSELEREVARVSGTPVYRGVDIPVATDVQVAEAK